MRMKSNAQFEAIRKELTDAGLEVFGRGSREKNPGLIAWKPRPVNGREVEVHVIDGKIQTTYRPGCRCACDRCTTRKEAHIMTPKCQAIARLASKLGGGPDIIVPYLLGEDMTRQPASKTGISARFERF